MSEIEVPKGWELTPLKEIIYFHGGCAFKSSDYVKEGTFVLRTLNIQNNGSITKNNSVFLNKELSEKYEQFILQEGDVLLVMVGATMGKIGYIDSKNLPALLNQNMWLLRPKNCDSRFLYYLISSIIKSKLNSSQGSARNFLRKSEILDLVLPIPPLEIQKKIAKKLDYIFNAFNDLKKEICILSNLKQIENMSNIAFNLLLDNSVGNKSNSRNNSNEKYKNKFVIGDYIEMLNGYAFKSEWFTSDEIKLVRNINMGHGIIRWDDPVGISNERSKKFQKFNLSEGDILISLDRPIISTGLKLVRVSKSDLPCFLVQRVGKFVFKNNQVLPTFFYYWLQSSYFMNEIKPGRSAGIPHISTKEIEKISFNPPDVMEQRKIIKIIEDKKELLDKISLDVKIAVESKQNSMQKLEKIAGSVLDNVFSGSLQN